jgi:cytidylate kinase
MGSFGDAVARLLATRLRYRLVERQVINQAAARVGSPELALAMVDELGLFGICPSDNLCHQYIDTIRTIVNDIADQDRAVIVGRGGQIILKGHPNTVHILVIAPLDLRVQRIAQEQNISTGAAQSQAIASDRHRTQYLKRFYDAEWLDPELYDLVLNTAHLDRVDEITTWISILMDQLFTSN